jgi:small subunit ribosomal protein S18
MAQRKSKACFFCENKQEPDYKDLEPLKQFISGRGKIVGRSKTGVCRKHQRGLATAIKRARHLAFLPFITRVK